MNVNDIVKLIDKLNETSINELKISEDSFQLHISKNNMNINSITSTVPTNTTIVNSSPIEKTNSSIANNENNHNTIDVSDIIVKSPLVGIYYESSSPDGEPLVSVGQKVKKGDVLCIIEAMKIFNEIKSPSNGIIKKIFASNLEVIEYDQELIVIGEE